MNPKFWNLLQKYKKVTGTGVLINTSFNVMDEPIVNTPEDAYRCFMNSGIDVLVMENFFNHEIMEFVKEFSLFKRTQKVVVAPADPHFHHFGSFYFLTNGSALAPFIYSLF